MSNLLKRIITALVLAPIFVFILYKGGIPFFILVTVLFFAMFYEWVGLSRKIEHTFLLSVFGFIYLGFSSIVMLFLERMRVDIFGLKQVPVLLFSLVILVWINDIFSYFAGKAIGGPKIAPKISPNKTWAGSVGGIVACVSFFLIVNYFTNGNSPYQNTLQYLLLPLMVILGNLFIASICLHILIPIIALAGDLFESYIKRKAGVKDSGNLIPGHGGLLDRFDGLLLVLNITGLVFVILYMLGSGVKI